MHQNVINDIKYINSEISRSNESATEKFTLDSDILPSRTNLSTNAQGFEQERYKIPLQIVSKKKANLMVLMPWLNLKTNRIFQTFWLLMVYWTVLEMTCLKVWKVIWQTFIVL